jgi:sulfite reductase (NADPH) hemoprotein beta-component
MGIDRYRELVDEEWERIKDGSLKVPQEEIDRINAYFASPEYEVLEDISEELDAVRKIDEEFDRWMKSSVVAHKVPGYSIVNITLKAPGRVPGDINADDMDAMADLADQYSLGEIRISHRQNLTLVDVKQQALHSLWQELKLLELATPNLGQITDIICCPGLDYCGLANARSIPVADDINQHFVDVDRLALVGDLTINISGCMNACGHHHVGNIGILGVDKRGKEFFQLTLGGSSDERASLGDRLGPGLPQADVPIAIEAIVDQYLQNRQENERFLDTYRRIGIEPFKKAVYGTPESKDVA